MLGLIAKVLALCLFVVAGMVVALNQSGAATWGTIRLTAPDRAPCDRLATTFKNPPLLTEVRWAWVQHQYGWGCYYEFGDDSKANIPYARVVGPTQVAGQSTP
jgi:hypothetical protein